MVLANEAAGNSSLRVSSHTRKLLALGRDTHLDGAVELLLEPDDLERMTSARLLQYSWIKSSVIFINAVTGTAGTLIA